MIKDRLPAHLTKSEVNEKIASLRKQLNELDKHHDKEFIEKYKPLLIKQLEQLKKKLPNLLGITALISYLIY